MMKNRLLDFIQDKMVFSSDNFNKEKTTCLEYGGLEEILLTFKIGNDEINISINPNCFYSINGRDYLNSMVTKEDMKLYRKGEYSCWYTNYFFININDNEFIFHDMNEDAERFLEFLKNMNNNTN